MAKNTTEELILIKVDAKHAEKVLKKLTSAIDGNKKAVKSNEAQVKTLAKENKGLSKAVRGGSDSQKAAAAAVSANTAKMEKLKTATKGLKEQTKTLKKSQEASTEAAGEQEASLAILGDGVNGVTGSLGALKAGLSALYRQMIKNPYLAVAAALAGLVLVFKESTTGGELFQKIGAGISGTFRVVVTTVEDLVNAIAKLDFRGMVNAFSGMGANIKRAAKNAYEMEAALIAVNKQIRIETVARSATLLHQSQLKLVAEDVNQTFVSRIKAYKDLLQLESAAAERGLKAEQAKLDALKKQNAGLTEEGKKVQAELNVLQKNYEVWQNYESRGVQSRAADRAKALAKEGENRKKELESMLTLGSGLYAQTEEQLDAIAEQEIVVNTAAQASADLVLGIENAKRGVMLEGKELEKAAIEEVGAAKVAAHMADSKSIRQGLDAKIAALIEEAEWNETTQKQKEDGINEFYATVKELAVGDLDAQKKALGDKGKLLQGDADKAKKRLEDGSEAEKKELKHRFDIAQAAVTNNNTEIQNLETDHKDNLIAIEEEKGSRLKEIRDRYNGIEVSDTIETNETVEAVASGDGTDTTGDGTDTTGAPVAVPDPEGGMSKLDQLQRATAVTADAIRNIWAFQNREVENRYAKMYATLEKQRKSGFISEEVYAKKRESLDTKMAREKHALEVKQHNANKALSFLEAGINTAVAATAALPNVILSGIIIAAGAVQAGIILASPPPPAPSFADGGDVSSYLVGGKKHSQGGTRYRGEDGNEFEVERGEGIFVTKSDATSEALMAIDSINKGYGGNSMFGHSHRWLQDGGPAVSNALGAVEEALARRRLRRS